MISKAAARGHIRRNRNLLLKIQLFSLACLVKSVVLAKNNNQMQFTAHCFNQLKNIIEFHSFHLILGPRTLSSVKNSVAFVRFDASYSLPDILLDLTHDLKEIFYMCWSCNNQVSRSRD